ncbi:MAG: hypothetical protein MJY89_06800 [Bacteroidales bacterium]|nr:hypothetical protein [Bacteroidales bacterium]
MRKTMIFAMLLVCSQAFAQLTTEELKSQYERQVKVVGVSGVGVENILDKWARVNPDDCDMLEARFHYYYVKSVTSKLVEKDQAKYLGLKPAFTLKDSLGRDVNYFEEHFFDDSLFAMGQKYIDRAVTLSPNEIIYRFEKLNALLDYEKDSPDIVASELDDLINYNTSLKPEWTYDGQPFDDDDFVNAIQEYCYTMFQLGSPRGYDIFLEISEKMSALHPKNTVFLSNIGSYWLVYKKNDSQALKYYNKVLKINPKDYTAAKNCVVVARKENNVKLEKKYLPILIAATESEVERTSYELRLKSL